MSNSNSGNKQKSGLVQRQLNKGVQLAKEDGKSLASFGAEGLSSGAYVYPLHGVYYLLRNPKLLQGLYPVIYKSAIWSAGITAALFILTYMPQVAVLALVSGPLAFIAAIPVVLAEAYVCSMFAIKSMLLPGATEKIFDAVLAAEGYTSLVERGRTLKTSGGSVTLGKSLLKPVSSRFSTEGLWRQIILLPMNLIPGVGTAAYLYLNGSKQGPSLHSRYFQLKGLDKSGRQQFVEQRRGAYTTMGMASCALQLVPVVGVLTSFTSAVGAALYAVDLEKHEGKSGPVQPGQEAGSSNKKEINMGRGDEL